MPAMTDRNPDSAARRIERAMAERFGETVAVDRGVPNLAELARGLEHRSCRSYAERPIDAGLLRLLFACALSAPSKSDLQQADIVRVADPAKRRAIADLVPTMPWLAEAPEFLVFCGNGRRIRQIAELRGKPFANDHLDAVLNAAVDAGIVLAGFIRAAAAVGLGCCPISAIRNRAEEVSRLIGLPDRVFPVAGLCVGYPAEPGRISPRLPMAVTVHRDRFDEAALTERIDAYDRRRHAVQPYRAQRDAERYGVAPFYGWSEDKARQYSRPERADFGAFLRRRGFRLD